MKLETGQFAKTAFLGRLREFVTTPTVRELDRVGSRLRSEFPDRLKEFWTPSRATQLRETTPLLQAARRSTEESPGTWGDTYDTVSDLLRSRGSYGVLDPDSYFDKAWQVTQWADNVKPGLTVRDMRPVFDLSDSISSDQLRAMGLRARGQAGGATGADILKQNPGLSSPELENLWRRIGGTSPTRPGGDYEVFTRRLDLDDVDKVRAMKNDVLVPADKQLFEPFHRYWEDLAKRSPDPREGHINVPDDLRGILRPLFGLPFRSPFDFSYR